MIADYRLLINRDLPFMQRGCSSKVGFVSRREARTAVRRGRHGNPQLDPYHCRWCGLWHLGHAHRVA
ncbi:MAG TPA: hypothetical protein VJ506_03720 [Candidatus Limnocylindrales bacterium]|nr:hypothetical protein [Candidatus Limnocylindrales bacterium]